MFFNVGTRISAAAVMASFLFCAHPGQAGDPTPSKGGSVAVVNGISITEDELMKAAAGDLEKLELQRLQFDASLVRSHHEVLEWNLSRMIEARVLAAEASKQGMTVEALLAKELNGKFNEPTQQDVSAYYEANKARIGRALETVNSQIFEYLKNESYNKAKNSYVEGLKKEYGVTVSLAPLRVKVDPAGRPARGSESAPVTMIEFSDFQCPYCANLSKTLHQVLDDFGKDVRLVYRQFPLSQIHPNAQLAAEASLCAAEQGHFWEMHDLMFKDQKQLTEEYLKADAARLNLDAEGFNQCLNSHRYVANIREDVREGSSLGVSGTPAIFINGRMLSGAQSYDEIAKVIREELSR